MAEEEEEIENPLEVGNCPKDLLLFRAAVSTIFHNISHSVSIDRFNDSWTILKKKRKMSEQLYKLMTDTMYEKMVDDFDKFIVDDCLIEKFNILRKLSEESQTNSDHIAWRPPGNVEEHLRSLDGNKIRQHNIKLNEYVANIEADNQKLLQQVTKGRTAANRVELKADRLLNQQNIVRSEFEKTVKQLEQDIKKVNS